MSAEKDPPIQNQILTALPRQERERLLPHLEPVSLERGAVLCEPGQVLRHGLFPGHGAVCIAVPGGER